jgi:hypothetical protein
MPSKEAHLAIAERNQQCIDYLKQDLSHYAEWVTTVAFYKALHLVDALHLLQIEKTVGKLMPRS